MDIRRPRPPGAWPTGDQEQHHGHTCNVKDSLAQSSSPLSGGSPPRSRKAVPVNSSRLSPTKLSGRGLVETTTSGSVVPPCAFVSADGFARVRARARNCLACCRMGRRHSSRSETCSRTSYMAETAGGPRLGMRFSNSSYSSQRSIRTRMFANCAFVSGSEGPKSARVQALTLCTRNKALP